MLAHAQPLVAALVEASVNERRAFVRRITRVAMLNLGKQFLFHPFSLVIRAVRDLGKCLVCSHGFLSARATPAFVS